MYEYLRYLAVLKLMDNFAQNANRQYNVMISREQFSNVYREVITRLRSLRRGWLKNIKPVFISMRRKTNRTVCARFSPALNKLRVFATNSDWFMVQIAPVVIGLSNYLFVCFSRVI